MDERLWAYRRNDAGEIEAKIFQNAAEVPQGWADSPARVDEQGAQKAAPPAAPADGAQRPEDSASGGTAGAPATDEAEAEAPEITAEYLAKISKRDAVPLLTARGVAFDPKAPVGELRRLLSLSYFGEE